MAMSQNPPRVPVKRTEKEVREIFKSRYDEGVRLSKHTGVPLFIGRHAARVLWRKYGVPTPPPLDDLKWLGYTSPQTAALNGLGPSTYWEGPWEGAKAMAYWVANIDEATTKWKQRQKHEANPFAETKERLLQINPPTALPVIKKGMYPQMILGGLGDTAVYNYRGFELEVVRETPTTWEVNLEPQSLSSRYFTQHLASPTFDDAVCTGKIAIDLQKAIMALPPEEGGYLRRSWQFIFEVVEAQLEMAYPLQHHPSPPPTRSVIARQLEELRRPRHTDDQSFVWWNSLPVAQRLQIIDDVIRYALCVHGDLPMRWAP
jgi:hypothetical protein